jgi:hypothetical protein
MSKRPTVSRPIFLRSRDLFLARSAVLRTSDMGDVGCAAARLALWTEFGSLGLKRVAVAWVAGASRSNFNTAAETTVMSLSGHSRLSQPVPLGI